MRRWGISAIIGLCAVLSLALAPLGARAGSRFETTPTARAEAAASLDFSIVIPEMVYVGSLKGDNGEEDRRPIVSEKSLNIKIRGSYTAITNGGTIVISSAERTQMRSAEPGDANAGRESPVNRVYVVAIP